MKRGRPTLQEQRKKKYRLKASIRAKERYHNDSEFRARKLAYAKKWLKKHPGRVKALYRSNPEYRLKSIERVTKYKKNLAKRMRKLGLTQRGTIRLTKKEKAVISAANLAKARRLTPEEKSKASKDFWASKTHEERVLLTKPAREKYYRNMKVIRKAKELWGPAYREVLRDLSSDADSI